MGAAVHIREVPPLPDRISAALTGSTTSVDVERLIREAEDGLVELDRVLGDLEAKSLDPLTAAREVETARRRIETQSFARRRLDAALGRLRGRLEEVRGQERSHAASEAYAAAKLQRDSVAAEFKREYPTFAGKLAELLHRVREADAAVALVNRNLSGNAWLAPVEKLTRDAGQTGADTCREIAGTVRLPAFGAAEAPLWPPPLSRS